MSRSADLSGLVTALSALFILFTGTARAADTWADITYAPGNPIHLEGGLLLHDGNGAVHAFSASARKWTSLAATGSPILGTGDWVAIVEKPGAVVGYSARRHAKVEVSIAASPDLVQVEDDVALVIARGVTGGLMAMAYSAVTGAFQTIAYLPTQSNYALDVATSRFVIVLRGSNGVFGFSARHGLWQQLASADDADVLLADGNVGLVEVPSPDGGPLSHAAAFSGITGSWAWCRNIHTGSGRVEHNVAYAENHVNSNQFRACAYSAYNDRWASSTVIRQRASQTARLSDNVISIQSAYPGEPGFEVIGSRPALNWTIYTDQIVQYVPIGDDMVFARDAARHELLSFSGVCDGSFDVQPIVGAFFSPAAGAAHMAYGYDAATGVHGYSPLTNQWTGHPTTSVFIQTIEESVMDAKDSSGSTPVFTAYSTRWAHWTPATSSWPAGTFNTVSGGSVIAHQRTVNPGLGDILLYDERCDSWAAPFNPGGLADLVAGRNLVLVKRQDADQRVHGYSVQRGEWTTPAGAAPGTPIIDPRVEENVGYYVDSAGRLFGFGSHADFHVWYQYPNGTEYMASGLAPIQSPPSPVGLSAMGDPVESVYLLASLDKSCPGVLVGAWKNRLCLDLSSLQILGFLGTVGSHCVMPILSQLGTETAPSCAQFWLQGAFNGGPEGKRFGMRCEPLRTF